MQHLNFIAQPLFPDKGSPNFSVTHHAEGKSLKEIVNDRVAVVEKEIIGRVLKEEKGNKSRTAKKLQVDYKALLRKIKAYGIG